MPSCPVCGIKLSFRHLKSIGIKHMELCQYRFAVRLDSYMVLPWYKKIFNKKPRMKYPDGDPFIKFVNKIINES